MNIHGKIILITGGASGIGRALALRFAADGARHVAIADLDEAQAAEVAAQIGPIGSAARVDVRCEEEIRRFVHDTEARAGAIDLVCSNAGILAVDADIHDVTSAPNDLWQRAWEVNVMAHVYAARAALPSMISRRSGYFLHTASAAGLLSQIGGAPYATTKHAAIGFAESLAIGHKDDGIKVSVLCPQAVATPMVDSVPSMFGADIDGVITPEAVAQCVVDGLASESFLILPHPKVRTYLTKKVEDYDRWIGGMAKLRRSVRGSS